MILNRAANFLVIESDLEKLKSLTIVARFSGAGNIVACQSTQEAEAAIEKSSFSFVLCRDNLLPESGCAFVARMRNQNFESPVVFVSTAPAAHNILQASDIAQTEFLTMPFSLAELKSCIHRLTITDSSFS
jgi:DNA-binding NtrC family response regulator